MYRTTERLLLRNIEIKDNTHYLKFVNSEYVQKYNCLSKKNIEQVNDYIERNCQNDNCIVITRENEDVLIGVIIIDEDTLRYNVNSIEISFWLAEEYTKFGYMTEALECIIDYLFTEIKIDSITARVFSKNTQSISLLNKLNFKKEGVLSHAIKAHNNVIYDDVLFSLNHN